MIVSRASPELRIVSTKSRCSEVSSVSSSSPVIPITPFIGVRISWLMLARNSLLACPPASAIDLACSRLSISSFWRVMSMIAPITLDGFPSTSSTRPLLRYQRTPPSTGEIFRNSCS